jgi:hypothetical protein
MLHRGRSLCLDRRIHVAHVCDEQEVIHHSAKRLVEQEFDEDVALAELCLALVQLRLAVRERLAVRRLLLLLALGRGGGCGDVGGEGVFEEGLPDDVGRAGDDAE